MNQKTLYYVLAVALMAWFAYENRSRQADPPAAESIAMEAGDDAGIGPVTVSLEPWPDDKPAPRVCRTKTDMFHLMFGLRQFRSGAAGNGTPIDGGMLLQQTYGDIPRHPSVRILVFFFKSGDGPFVLLDDFVTADPPRAPRLELVGDQLKYVDRRTEKVIRQVTCSTSVD